jgi:hypothetical protein
MLKFVSIPKRQGRYGSEWRRWGDDLHVVPVIGDPACFGPLSDRAMGCPAPSPAQAGEGGSTALTRVPEWQPRVDFAGT